jgi:hypothetical protein
MQLSFISFAWEEHQSKEVSAAELITFTPFAWKDVKAKRSLQDRSAFSHLIRLERTSERRGIRGVVLKFCRKSVTNGSKPSLNPIVTPKKNQKKGKNFTPTDTIRLARTQKQKQHRSNTKADTKSHAEATPKQHKGRRHRSRSNTKAETRRFFSPSWCAFLKTTRTHFR